MPPGINRPRRIIPINKLGNVEFRVIGGKLYIDRPHSKTNWSSCNKKTDTKYETIGAIGITSAGQTVYGAIKTKFSARTEFSKPCGE